MKKKVGLVTCYFKHNYGSMLQAYATQKILDNNNIPNETIYIENNVDFKKGKRKYYLGQIFNYTFIKSKLGMIKLKFDKKVNRQLGNNIAIRDKKYEEFKKNFHLTKAHNTYDELCEICQKKYDSVLVGSDQLWLPVNVVADYYTLNWVPENINKISYATSFGISTIPDKYKDLYGKFLNRIDYISVRENQGELLVKELSSKNATLVCDPTMLLTKKEWQEVSISKPIVKEKYILCYYLGKSIEYRKFAERLKEKTGYKIVSLNHCDEYVKYSDTFADIKPYDIGPAEWLNLIENAEFICTDSFHGTVFSLLFNKKFFTFRRYKEGSKVSTNSRINSLLNLVHLNDRLLTGNENVDEVINKKIDYVEVDKIISQFRNESKQFLINAINKGE